MVLPGKQPGLLVAVIVPALLSTLVVIARSMSKVKRRPDYISKTGAITAETLLIASVVCLQLMMTSERSENELTSVADFWLDLGRLRHHIDSLWVRHPPGGHTRAAKRNAEPHQCSLLADHRILL
jgi:hypothetical protein